jgi:hypothetical protein
MRELFCILTAVTLLGGCRSSSDPAPLKPIPIQLRSSFPADSVTVAPGVFDLSVAFNQEIQDDDVRVLMVPAARSPGTLQIHGRSYDRLGIVPSSYGLAQRVLLDGPRFLRPYLIRIYTGDASGDWWIPSDLEPGRILGDLGQIGQMDGEISSPPGGPDPTHCVIFAYERDGLGEFPDPELVFEIAQPVSIALAEQGSPSPGVVWYRVNNLVTYERYTVIVVLDTSGEGNYDPREDWWGYPQDPHTFRLTEAEAHFYVCTPRLDQVRLRRPIGSNPAP